MARALAWCVAVAGLPICACSPKIAPNTDSTSRVKVAAPNAPNPGSPADSKRGRKNAPPIGQTPTKSVKQDGHLVLIGGGKKPASVMRLFVSLAGGRDGRIVVLPLASEDSRDTGVYYTDLLRQHGAGEIAVVHVDERSDASRPDLVKAVAAADGVFFSGGDQRRIADRMVGTPMQKALADVRRRGGVIGGTSAGTACQSELMLTGDGDLGVVKADNVVLVPGLAQLRHVIVDQHFVARQRNNRLLSVILEHPDQIGMGIDEATAVWFKPDGNAEVVGEGWVIVYDAGDARVVTGADGRLGAVGLHQHILLPGQRFDLSTRRVVGLPKGYTASP